MQSKEQYFRLTPKIYTELNNPKAIIIMAFLTSYGKEIIEVEQTHLARICGYKGKMPQRFIKPTIDKLVKEGWIDSYEKVKANNGYKSVTTRWHISEKGLSLSAPPPTIQNKREKEENKQTIQKHREQGDAPIKWTNPQCSNTVKQNTHQTQPTNTAKKRFNDIAAARQEYNRTHKFTI